MRTSGLMPMGITMSIPIMTTGRIRTKEAMGVTVEQGMIGVSRLAELKRTKTTITMGTTEATVAMIATGVMDPKVAMWTTGVMGPRVAMEEQGTIGVTRLAEPKRTKITITTGITEAMGIMVVAMAPGSRHCLGQLLILNRNN